MVFGLIFPWTNFRRLQHAIEISGGVPQDLIFAINLPAMLVWNSKFIRGCSKMGLPPTSSKPSDYFSVELHDLGISYFQSTSLLRQKSPIPFQCFAAFGFGTAQGDRIGSHRNLTADFIHEFLLVIAVIARGERMSWSTKMGCALSQGVGLQIWDANDFPIWRAGKIPYSNAGLIWKKKNL